MKFDAHGFGTILVWHMKFDAHGLGPILLWLHCPRFLGIPIIPVPIFFNIALLALGQTGGNRMVTSTYSREVNLKDTDKINW